MSAAASTHASERNGKEPSVRVLPGMRGVAAALYQLLVADLALAQVATLRALLQGAMALVFGATAWALFVGAAVFGLVHAGLAWPWAFLLVAMASVALCLFTIAQARRYLEHTTLKATRGQIDALFESETQSAGLPR